MKMKKYATFDLWAADQTPKHRKMVTVLRKVVKKAAPKLVESVKWGNGCWIGTEWPVAYVYADEDHLQFGFFGGSDLKDPKGLLEGSGKYVRHIKLRKLSDIDPKVISKFVREAVKNQED